MRLEHLTLARRILASALVAVFAVAFVVAEAPEPSAEAQALASQEALRARVETIFAKIPEPVEEHAEPVFTTVADALVAMGPDVAPLMAAELENRSRITFNVAAYVLGFLGTPGSKEALRRAAEAAERDGREFGRDRLAWIAYAIALSGDPTAVDLLDQSKHKVVRKPFVFKMSVLELSVLMSRPASRPKILEMVDRYASDAARGDLLIDVLRAARPVVDPSVTPRVAPFLDHPEPAIREVAAKLLGACGDRRAVDRLWRALDDPMPLVRQTVANALEESLPTNKTRALLKRLEVEDYLPARSALYRILAETEGAAAVDPLLKQANRADPMDRLAVIDTLASLRSRQTINFMRSSLKDPDLRVALRAVSALGAIGGAGAADSLVALLADPRWPMESEAMRVLAAAREPRAVPRILERLRSQLARPIVAPEDRDPLTQRLETLIAFRDASALPDVEGAETTQPDPTVRDILSGSAMRLRALRDYGDDPARWAEAIGSPTPAVRRLACERLAELPAPVAVPTLMDAFGRADRDEAVEILRGLGRLADPAAAPLLERVLLDPNFDAWENAAIRSMAAWAAGRVGGERMADALRRAAARRDGRDLYVLVYWAGLEGVKVADAVDDYALRRLRYFDWTLGPEHERLDWITRRLRSGRSIAALSGPPDEIAINLVNR